jgi:hypothetical protein
MGKVRSCRRTDDENKIHEKAVKMRKMTDEQLVHYVEDRVRKAESEGYGRGCSEASSSAKDGSMDIINEFLNSLSDVQGIGKVTVKKLKEFAKAGGYIAAD